jgi:prolyl-tRNA synthetase
VRLSTYFLPTLKEIPKDAQEISHILLMKSGLVKPLMSGVYEYLPLGFRVIKNIQKIIREEMDRIGGQELLLPVLSNRELWEETKRWDDFGDEMFKLMDRNKRDVCLAPTHEEIITDLARREIRSYRDLPQIWYQIQTKFRDEPRPRGAVLRMRQFFMKDSYTLDTDFEGLEKSFKKHFDAYTNIFTRCGLDTVVVGASSGVMGGSESNEFMFLSESGEDSIAVCDNCTYSANVEVASTRLEKITGEAKELTEIHTPVPGTVEEVSKLLNKPKRFLIKSLLYIVEDRPVFVLIRGDHSINEGKLESLFGFTFRPAKGDEVRNLTGADIGYISPIGIKEVEVIADENLEGCSGMVTGANKNEYHMGGVDISRDITVSRFADVVMVEEEDPCPLCENGKLSIKKAIELGHLFKLGTKYSEAMKALFTDQDGKEKPIVMGSYGIGVERLMAAIIDKHHDGKGIVWPINTAPFLVHIIPIDVTNPKVKEISEKIYAEIKREKIEVLIDDRDERPGFKFNDADLIGIPIHIIIGSKSLTEGYCEVRLRCEEKKEHVRPEEIVKYVQNLIEKRNESL